MNFGVMMFAGNGMAFPAFESFLLYVVLKKEILVNFTFCMYSDEIQVNQSEQYERVRGGNRFA